MWLRRGPEGACRTLEIFWLPCAGSGASGDASALRRCLSPTIQVSTVQLPGREERHAEPPCDDLGRLLAALGPVLAAQARGRFVLAGHSFGGFLAHRLSVWLREHGGPMPCGLVLSGIGPRVARPAPSAGADDAQLRQQLLDRLGAEGLLPQAATAHPPWIEQVLRTYRADLAVYHCAAGQPAPRPLDLPILACHGTDDASAPAQAVRGWRDATTGPVTLRAFNGGHMFIRYPGFWPALGTDITQWLTRHHD